MSRQWQHIERYLDRLAGEVYAEPPSPNHIQLTHRSFDRFVVSHKEHVKQVLDVGCGQGSAMKLFKEAGMEVIGVTLGADDAEACRKQGFDVRLGDQSFLDFPDGSFDLVWSRHCLEHSAMPLLTLFEYNRVLREGKYCYVEVPQPDSVHIENPNHYSLFSDRGWRNLFKRANLDLVGYTIYALPYRFPSGVTMDDYYYAYWLRKRAPVI